jgi:hypothetical protein
MLINVSLAHIILPQRHQSLTSRSSGSPIYQNVRQIRSNRVHELPYPSHRRQTFPLPLTRHIRACEIGQLRSNVTLSSGLFDSIVRVSLVIIYPGLGFVFQHHDGNTRFNSKQAAWPHTLTRSRALLSSPTPHRDWMPCVLRLQPVG